MHTNDTAGWYATALCCATALSVGLAWAVGLEVGVAALSAVLIIYAVLRIMTPEGRIGVLQIRDSRWVDAATAVVLAVMITVLTWTLPLE